MYRLPKGIDKTKSVYDKKEFVCTNNLYVHVPKVLKVCVHCKFVQTYFVQNTLFTYVIKTKKVKEKKI